MDARGDTCLEEVESIRADLLQTQISHSNLQAPETPGFETPADPPELVKLAFRTTEGAALTAQERVDLLKPVAWFRVPKTGTSFCNTLYHNLEICPGFPADQFITETESGGAWNTEWRSKEAVCPGGWSQTFDTDITGRHAGLDTYLYEANRGHLVGMFRQPEQRVISGYYTAQDPSADQIEWPYDTPAKSLREYAEVMAGCSVRQMTRGGGDACGLPPLPNPGEVTLAVQRLRHGFAFVGLTDEWDLSICLFHAMFGGDCHSFEVKNIRPGVNSTSSGYDTSDLGGFVDPYDGALYEEAKSIFFTQLPVYGVELSKCQASCVD